MNTDRLLREIGKRLDKLSPADREEALDAVREEIGRERRRSNDPEARVEVERERRLEAETLREVLEAIHHQSRLAETIEEILKQIQRLVNLDSCTLALSEPGGGFRVVAGRGLADPKLIVGHSFQNGLSDEVARGRCLTIPDVRRDPRFAPLPGSADIRSCAGIPLVVEGEVIGMIRLERNRIDPFDEEDLHRARVLAFSAAAAIRNARLLDQVRRYARLMERAVAVDQAVFSNQKPDQVAAAILDGALRFGDYPGGLLVLRDGGDLRVVAAQGEAFDSAQGLIAPEILFVDAPLRLEPGLSVEAGRLLGVALPAESLYLVPLGTGEARLGSLVLQDPNGETPDDQLLEAFTTRAAAAYVHSLRTAR
ncbi:MAG TPA: GAF domain-containing protein [Vicinamibacteria bacterium]|nr:GAF domain-containing protein [Vicinamibacteria bacterium]